MKKEERMEKKEKNEIENRRNNGEGRNTCICEEKCRIIDRDAGTGRNDGMRFGLEEREEGLSDTIGMPFVTLLRRRKKKQSLPPRIYQNQASHRHRGNCLFIEMPHHQWQSRWLRPSLSVMEMKVKKRRQRAKMKSQTVKRKRPLKQNDGRRLLWREMLDGVKLLLTEVLKIWGLLYVVF